MSEILLVNPRHRRRRSNPHKHHRKHVARRSNPHKRHHRRKNPMSMSNIKNSSVAVLKEGAVGAAGGLLADVVAGYANPYLISSLGISSSPATTLAVKLVSAILIGMVGNKLARGYGKDLSVGAATVAIHDFAKVELAAAMPTLPLGDYMTIAPSVGSNRGATYNPQANGVNALRQSTYRPVGAYLTLKRGNPSARGGMGEYLGDAAYAMGIPT